MDFTHGKQRKQTAKIISVLNISSKMETGNPNIIGYNDFTKQLQKGIWNPEHLKSTRMEN